MNLGVAGGPAVAVDGKDATDPPAPRSWPPTSESTNGTNEPFAGVFGGTPIPTDTFLFEAGIIGGGGISSGPGSLYTAIFELELEAADTVRLLFPACFNVVPPSFFTSGTFSFTLVLRVPRSCQASADVASVAACDSSPVGSTKIWSREFGVFEEESGVETLRDDVLEVEAREEGAPEEGLREVVASAGLGFCEDVGGAGGSIILLIIRFWKSLYRSCR